MPPPPTQPPSQTPQQQLTQLRQQYQAVCEMLWEAVTVMAPGTHEVVVQPHASDPLWELCFVRVEGPDKKPDPTGGMRICAAKIPELTEQEKKRIVRLLRDTDKPLIDALTELSLPHPPSYVETKIADRIKWKPDEKNPAEGIWESVTQAGIGEKLANIVHFPK